MSSVTMVTRVLLLKFGIKSPGGYTFVVENLSGGGINM